MTSARAAAAQLLARWQHQSDPPTIPERNADEWKALNTRDRGFAFDLVTGVIRRRLTLDAVIAYRLSSSIDKLEPKVLAILRIGAYQLLMHDSARSYAAVDSSVELTRELGIEKVAGLVNAVLRGITRLQPVQQPRQGQLLSSFPLDFKTHVRFSANIFPNPHADPLGHLTVVTSHPRELVAALIDWHTLPVAANILIRNNLRPTVILRADDPAYVPPHEAGVTAHETPGNFAASSGWNEIIEAAVAAGALSPQDPTAGKVVRRLGELALAPRRVLDFCAGLGTKSIQMARLWPAAEIVASDPDAAKLGRLMQRAQQIGVKNITSATPAQLAGTFDVILVDAPCSNTGVMARRVQSRWRWPQLDVAKLAATQRDILERACTLLSPAGVLAYATCSIDPRENQQLVEAFAQRHPTLKKIAEESTLPSFTDDPTQTQDGGYLAIFRA